MTKYATFNNDGFPIGFYSEDIHGNKTRPIYGEPVITPGEDGEPDIVEPPSIIGNEPNPDCKIPGDAVEITDVQWMEFLDNQGMRRWNGKTVVKYTAPVPDLTNVDVNNERQRRILAGTTVDGIRVTGTDNDTRNLMGLALGAQLRLAGGDNETITTFRDADNVDHDLTPEQVLNLWQKSAAFVSMLYQKSWAIKELDPIPPTFTANKYWS